MNTQSQTVSTPTLPYGKPLPDSVEQLRNLFSELQKAIHYTNEYNAMASSYISELTDGIESKTLNPFMLMNNSSPPDARYRHDLIVNHMSEEEFKVFREADRMMYETKQRVKDYLMENLEAATNECSSPREFMAWAVVRRDASQEGRSAVKLWREVFHSLEGRLQKKLDKMLAARDRERTDGLTSTVTQDADDLCTANDIAKLVHLEKRSIYPYRKKWPKPDVPSAGRAPAKWSWQKLRPTVEQQFPNIDLPATLPRKILTT